MALSKAAQDLEELIKCPICLDNFSDPRSLPCLHSFCVKCLDQTQRAKEKNDPTMKGHINCPTCTEQSKLPQNSVYNLRHYFMADQVTSVVKDLHRAKDERDAHQPIHFCKWCTRNAEAISYCFDCTTPLCALCLVEHQNKNAKKLHTNIATTAQNIALLVCTEHGKFAEDFCIQCMRITCRICHVVNHRDHLFRAFTLQQDVEGQTLYQMIVSDISELKKYLKSLHHAERESLKQIPQRWNVAMKDQRGRSHDTLMSEFDRVRKSVARHLHTLKRIQKKASRTVSPIKGIPHLYICKIQTILQEQSMQIPDFDYVPRESTETVGDEVYRHTSSEGEYISVLPAVEAHMSNLADVHITSIHVLSDEKIMFAAAGKVYISDQISTCTCMLLLPGLNMITKLAVQSHKLNCKLAALNHTDTKRDVAFMCVTFTPRTVIAVSNVISVDDHANCLAFTEEGELIVCSQHLIKYNASGDEVWKRWACFRMNSPCRDVTVARDGSILVAVDKFVMVHNAFGEHMLQFVCVSNDPLITTRNMTMSPCGICVSCNGEIYVCDKSSHAVLVFNTSGRFIKSVYDFSGQLFVLQPAKFNFSQMKPNPQCISIRQDKLVVAHGDHFTISNQGWKSEKAKWNIFQQMTIVVIVFVVMYLYYMYHTNY